MFLHRIRTVVWLLSMLLVLLVACAPEPTPTPFPPTRTRVVPTAIQGRVVTATPGRSVPTVAQATATPPITVSEVLELKDALDKNKIKLQVVGGGLENIRLKLELNQAEPLEISIKPGVIFQARSASTQNMVVREAKRIGLVKLGVEVEVAVKVACANMSKSTPTAQDSFTLSVFPASLDLARLVSEPDLLKESFRVQQFAIWTITDNPPSAAGYVGLGSFGTGTGPTLDELAKMRVLFEKAGVNPADYRVFRSMDSGKPTAPPQLTVPSVAVTSLVVTHAPSPARFKEVNKKDFRYLCSYKTSVKAVGGSVLIKEFNMFLWQNEQWVRSDSNNGKPWSARDFADWYSCSQALIPGGQECSDPNNWNSSDTPTPAKIKWSYTGVDNAGRTVQGEAALDCLAP